jgi:hypothetical protein
VTPKTRKASFTDEAFHTEKEKRMTRKNGTTPSTPGDLDRRHREAIFTAIACARATDDMPEHQRRKFNRALRDVARLEARVRARALIAARARTPGAAPRRCPHCGRGHRRRPRSSVTSADLPPWVPIWDLICFSRLTRAARKGFLRMVEREEEWRAQAVSR